MKKQKLYEQLTLDGLDNEAIFIQTIIAKKREPFQFSKLFVVIVYDSDSSTVEVMI